MGLEGSERSTSRPKGSDSISRTTRVEVVHEVNVEVRHLIRKVVLYGIGHGTEEERELRAVHHCDHILRRLTLTKMLRGLTSEREVVPGDELREEVCEERLEGCSLLEQEPPRGEEHVVGVPRFAAVEEAVTRVVRAAERGIVRGVQRVQYVESAIRYRRWVDEQAAHESVERGVLLGRWHGETEKGFAEERAFVELRG